MRTEFQRNRITHAKTFPRLMYKTRVLLARRVITIGVNASMTDRYAATLYEKLFVSRLPRVLML